MIDTVQLLVFIHAVARDLPIYEDFVGLIPFCDITYGVDIKQAVLNVLHSKLPNLSLSKLVGLTRNGAPSMTGEENGTVVTLEAVVARI